MIDTLWMLARILGRINQPEHADWVAELAIEVEDEVYDEHAVRRMMGDFV